MGGVPDSVILSRLVADDGQDVVIEVGKPRPAESGVECVFRIDEQRFHSHGSDELAALHTAVTEIVAVLARANRDAGRARFALPAELGFPDPTTSANGTEPVRLVDGSGVGEVLARRVIEHEGRRHSITVGRPFRSPNHELALCPFQIDNQRRAVAGGWDGLQALLTALDMIGALLKLPQDWATTTVD